MISGSRVEISLPIEEWHFHKVTNEESYQCCIYEYGRESWQFCDLIYKWRKECPEMIKLSSIPKPNKENQFIKIQEQVLNKKPKELNTITGVEAERLSDLAIFFPKFPECPWLKLKKSERKAAASFISKPKDFVLQEDYWFVENYWRTELIKHDSTKEALNDLYLYIFEIDPDKRKSELIKGFEKWLNDKGFGKKSDGRKGIEKSGFKNRLKYLAVKRLRQKEYSKGNMSAIELIQAASESTNGWLKDAHESEWIRWQDKANLYLHQLFSDFTP